MWEGTARFVLKNKWFLLLFLLGSTAFMGWHASKVQLSYEFSKAIPTDNPKYIAYQEFKTQFGEDGNLLVIGCISPQLTENDAVFEAYTNFGKQLKLIAGVESVLSVPTAVFLKKDSATEKLKSQPIFNNGLTADSARRLFFSLPFYSGLLYNSITNAYLMGVRINKDILASKDRSRVVGAITEAGNAFGKSQNIEMHYSGLPLIRTQMADRIKKEMNWLLIGSLAISAIILLFFFRSISATLLSLLVVLLGVVWCVGIMHLLGYKITLLTAAIPTLIVVIGIPNCIYFLNKYHVSFLEKSNENSGSTVKEHALVQMISKMGVITLFCNIAAAIGFAVFAFTRSEILKEFGVVAGISIMVIFFISFILIPSALSMLPVPKERHTRYLSNTWLLQVLNKLELWSLNHRKTIYAVTIITTLIAIAGMFKLQSVGFIVDGLPKKDKIYSDLKFFETNFKGVMPLEIVIDTRQKNGIRKNPLQLFEKIDSLSQYIDNHNEIAKPLSLVEGLKFARQAYYDGDSSSYGLPTSFDIAFLAPYLSGKAGGDSNQTQNNFNKLLNSFSDTDKRKLRISVSMADIGSKRLDTLLKRIANKAEMIFNSDSIKTWELISSKKIQKSEIDSSLLIRKANIMLTGTSVTFLEGSSFIINGLRESILYAFILIAFCMLYLFRSFKILLCSLIPNIIPLVITAGFMGWIGVPLNPSTVLVFSVALGIAIDITIRFLVNYKQELTDKKENSSLQQLITSTIRNTGISIIYTSLVLIAGFVIFCFSGFGGTQALGWLTSLTLVIATFTNLILLPALLFTLNQKRN